MRPLRQLKELQTQIATKGEQSCLGDKTPVLRGHREERLIKERHDRRIRGVVMGGSQDLMWVVVAEESDPQSLLSPNATPDSASRNEGK